MKTAKQKGYLTSNRSIFRGEKPVKTIKNFLVFIATFILQAQIHAGDFFYNGKEPRQGFHYTTDELFNATIDQIPPGYILTSADPNVHPSTARMALITQDPVTGQWIVQYYIIESLPQKNFNTLQEAQEFTLQHLESGMPAQQQTTSLTRPARPAIPDRSKRGDWRIAHLNMPRRRT